MQQYLIDKLWKYTDHMYQYSDYDIHAEHSQIEETSPPNLDAPNRLTASGFFQDSWTLFMSFHPEGSNNNVHYHDFFELLYVCKGNPVGMINNQEISLQEGNICIMNPNAVHYFKKYTSDTDLILNILFPKELFQKSIFQILLNDPVLSAFFIRYRMENENQPSFLYLPHLDQDINILIEMLLKEYLDKKQYSHVIIESLLTLIFSIIIRSSKEKSSPDNAVMTEILDYIYLNYQTVNMGLVASHFNYHPKYLSALIHKHTGQTFRDLIVNIKLQNAVNYLLYTDYSIEQIVETIGYRDKSSFYSYFKKVYHTSPAQYRQLYS